MSQIITTSDLNSFTGKTLTAALAKQVVNAVNAYIERTTNRCWGDTVTVKEVHDYKRVIWLKHQDVVHVSKISSGYYGGTMTTLASTGYYCDSLGRLRIYPRSYWGYDSPRVPLAVEVTYAYGVDEVPDDLKLAALGIAASFYNWAAGGQKEVSATQVGSYRVEYAGSRRSADAMDTAAQSNFATVASYATKRS